MPYCKDCGKMISEGENCNCTISSAVKSMKETTHRRRKVLFTISLIVFIVAIVIIAYINLNAYKKPIKDLEKALQTNDSGLITDIRLTEEMYEELDDEIQINGNSMLGEALKYYDYEEVIKYYDEIVIEDKRELGNKKIRNYEEHYEYYYDVDCDIVKAYEVNCVGIDKSSEKNYFEVVVVKIEGDGWKLFDVQSDTQYGR